MDKQDNRLSYHDVIVYVDGETHRVAGNYAYQLSCTKAGGWRLFHVWGGRERLIGGEYGSGGFRIEVAGIVICGEKPERATDEVPARVGGWTGEVRNG